MPAGLPVVQWVMYLEAEDAKYSHWNAEECSSRWGECVYQSGLSALMWYMGGGGLGYPIPGLPPVAPPRPSICTGLCCPHGLARCPCRYCLEAHARAGMVVDTEAIKALLLDLLPRTLKGASVAELALRYPWPKGSGRDGGGTGLWWDV